VVGEIPAPELPSLYAAADAVVSLCDSDGTSVSVLEAMATGKPVIALENASLAEWISEPGGRLVPRGDPGNVADAIDVFLAVGRLREEAAAHNLAIVESRADRVAQMARMEQIYESLAATPSENR
jgi:glycosyltransferase involved in cell wall biosynthesis